MRRIIWIIVFLLMLGTLVLSESYWTLQARETRAILQRETARLDAMEDWVLRCKTIRAMPVKDLGIVHVLQVCPLDAYPAEED